MIHMIRAVAVLVPIVAICWSVMVLGSSVKPAGQLIGAIFALFGSTIALNLELSYFLFPDATALDFVNSAALGIVIAQVAYLTIRGTVNHMPMSHEDEHSNNDKPLR